MHEPYAPRQNHLLTALLPEEYARLIPHLELVPMPLGMVLYESGHELRHVYFPTTTIVSLLYVMIAGTAYRLHSRLLMNEINRIGGRRTGWLQHLLLRYTQTLITQISLNAVCNRHHSMEQQLCSWLLTCLDRSPTNELAMTHERIANTLGVRREGITVTAGRLQHEGLISYRRGHITVLDRKGIERRACECYRTVKSELDRLRPRADDNRLAADVGKRYSRPLGITPMNTNALDSSSPDKEAYQFSH